MEHTGHALAVTALPQLSAGGMTGESHRAQLICLTNLEVIVQESCPTRCSGDLSGD